MTNGLGPAEVDSRSESQDISQILKRGINAPYYLVQYGLLQIIPNDTMALRGASVTFGFIILACLFGFLRSWFGRFIALAAGLLFITTPWIILASRTAGPYIMYLWLIVLIALFLWVSRARSNHGFWWIMLCLGTGISLYTPGFIWLLAIATIAMNRSISQLIQMIKVPYLITGLTLLILIFIPLVLALTLEPSRIKDLMLIPQKWPGPLEILNSIGWSAVALFWQTRDAVDIGVDRLPILNILQTALVVFGLYALSSRAKSVTYVMVGLLAFSVLAAGVNQNQHLLLLGLPATAVFMSAGLRYLFLEWRRIFPLNPFAYGLAVSMIGLIIIAQLLYAGRYTLLAWPHTKETKSTYVLK